MNRLSRVILCVGAPLALAVAPASAQLVNFASFSPDANTPFAFTNSAQAGTFTTRGTIRGSFKYLVANGYDVAGNTTFGKNTIGATMFLTSTVSNTATATAVGQKTALDQPIASIVMQIVANTPQGGSTSLLTMSGTGDITGYSNGVLASFTGDTNASDNNTVTFGSDFLDFSPTVERSFNFALNPVQTMLKLNENGYLNSFTAGGIANFASNPPPRIVVPSGNPGPSASTPELSTLALLVLPAAVCGTVVARRKIRKV